MVRRFGHSRRRSDQDSTARSGPSTSATKQEDVGTQLLDEAMKEATWLRHLGEAGKVSIWVIAKRIPVVIGQIARLGWRASPRAMVTVVACTVLSAVLAGLALVESVHVLGVLFGPGASAARIRSAVPSVVVLVLLYSVRACSDTAINYGQAQLAPRIKRNAEIELYGLMARVKADAFVDADLADDLQRAADNGIGYLQQSVPGCIAVVSSILSMVSSAGVLAYLHPLLLPLLLLAVLPTGLASVRSARAEFRSRLRFSSISRRLWILAWILIDPEQANELRACAAGPRLFGEHALLADAVRDERIRLGREQAATALAGRAVTGVGTGIVYGTLAWMLTAGWLPLSRGLGAAMALRSVQSSLIALVLSVHGLFEQALWVQDLTDAITAARARLPRNTGVSCPDRFSVLELSGVEYSYPRARDDEDHAGPRPALTGVDLVIKAGEVTALVGSNGAGKSTLVKILAGLIEPDAGRVLWDGRDSGEFDSESVIARVAMCPQDATLYPITALGNIAVSEPDPQRIDQERARNAVAVAGAAEMIEELPRGWETVLSGRFRGGVELSGGQRAKAAIARAMYRTDVAMIILDEPTANLDPLAEAETYRTVMGLRERGDVAIVLVSHRLGAVVGADHIAVFDQGRIIESGTHPELVSHGGLYQRMYEAQSSMYVSGHAS